MPELTIRKSYLQTMKDIIEERIHSVQGWLLQQQRLDNSWKGSAWHTAKIMMALVETGVNPEHPKIKEGYQWLIDNREQRSATEVNWEGWTWDTALVVRCFKKLNYLDTDEYITKALKWMVDQERRDIEAPTPATYFGRCYTAQVVMALAECGIDPDDEDLKFFVNTLQQQQEPDGGWINNFDTAQIVEALIKANSSYTWKIQHHEEVFEGGLNHAVTWMEKQQSRFGNWDGLTWSTAWTLRSYLLAAKKYNPKVITLALGWLLEQQSSRNPSWFNEQGRTATAIITLRTVLNRLDNRIDPNLDLNMRRAQFYLGFEKFSREDEQRIEESEETVLKREINNLSVKLETNIKKIEDLKASLQQREIKIEKLSKEKQALDTQLRRFRLGISWGMAITFFVLSVLGYVYTYRLASYVFGAVGTLLAFIGYYKSRKQKLP